MVPVLNLAMADGIMNTVAGTIGSGQSFVAYEIVQVFGTSLRRDIGAWAGTTGQESGLVRDSRSSSAGPATTASSAFGRDRSREDE